MKMSRGLRNGAHQTKKLRPVKQGSAASTGVSYCEKCERRRLRKASKTRDKEMPPWCLVIVWLFFLLLHYFEAIDHFTRIVNCISMIFFGFVIILSSWEYLRVRLKRYCQPTLDPQLGYDRIDPYVKEAIQIWCLYLNLRDSKTKKGMCAAIVQYLQAHSQFSLPRTFYLMLTGQNVITNWSSTNSLSVIEEMFDEVFGIENIVETNEGINIVELDAQSGSTEQINWFQAMDSAFSNWKECKNSGIAKKITKLINTVVSAGLCSTAGLKFKVANVNLFSPIVSKKQASAADLFEAFYEAVTGFMKGGWRVFKTGEVSTFFVEEDRVADFDAKYNEIRSWHGYALTGNLREYTEIDDNEYESRLKKAIETGENLLKSIKRSEFFEHKYVSDRLDKLKDNDIEFTQLRTRGGLRIQPFGVSLFGQSGCGKSTLTSLTVNAGLKYNGLSAEKDRIATWADNDKYASSIRSHINAIIFDDFANTKEAFLDFSPAYRLIQVVNNIKYLAPMADVFLKGKVSLNPYFCIVSTNVEHLNAAVFSNEPESILRRFYHVKVIPKPEFCESGILSRRKIEEKFGMKANPDVWNLTVRRYRVMNVRYVKMESFEPVVFEGRTLQNVSVDTYLRWVQTASKIHFTEEGQMIARQELDEQPCKKCGFLYCGCADHPGDAQFDDASENSSICSETSDLDVGEELDEQSGYLLRWLPSWNSVWLHRRANELKNYYAHCSNEVSLKANYICSTWSKFDLLPERYVCHPSILKIGLFFWKEDLRKTLIHGLLSFIVVFLCFCFLCPSYSVLWLLYLIAVSYFYVCSTIQTYEKMVKDRILQSVGIVKTYVRSWQFRYTLTGMAAFALAMMYFRRQHALEAQTGLDPMSDEEIEERNAQVNPWLKSEVVHVPLSEPSKTTTWENLSNSIKTNLVGIVSTEGFTTLGFYMISNFLIVPTHFINAHASEDIQVNVYKTTDEVVGGMFRDKLSKAFRIDIPSTDFTLCFVTSGGSFKCMTKFLVQSRNIPKVAARILVRDIRDKNLCAHPILFAGSRFVKHTFATFLGGYYDLPFDSYKGMCMAPVISENHGSGILGFHLGGKGKIGGCGTLSEDQFYGALAELVQVNGVVLTASNGQEEDYHHFKMEAHMGTFPIETFGKKILESQEIHPKSATNFLPEGACIDIYGSVGGKATPRSNVTATMISPHVTEVFGVPQQWGPPKMKGKGRYPFQATLEHASKPSLPIGSVLNHAVGCMKSISQGIFNRIPSLKDCGPLEDVAAVSGLTDVRFIDGMNSSTSPGFPFGGAKSKFYVPLKQEDYPHIPCPKTFTPEIWDEYKKQEEILRSGKRCYSIWKSCLKDEATKLSKDKVRVFQSAPIVLQLMIRKYFLPLVRIIQLNPIAFECAVGVNAEGPEWQELWDAAMSKGKERVLAGDYSKYDIRMPAQTTIAAFDVLIDMAIQCDGYTADDIHLMQMMVSEIVYPVMAYNGDLIQLFGTNPSGQNLTVIINGFVNSLLLRCCFYTFYPEFTFKNECAFMTYGDDVIGTVSERCSKFTHINYADWLAEHDMKFTMPDKESAPTHYMKEEDVDFLKRKCVYNEDLGMKVGILSTESIFKRLHCHVLSKELTKEMHSAQNIESSLHDWFYYGRDEFEKRREQLREVATLAGITHLCPALDVSYDKRVAHWRHRYLGEEIPQCLRDESEPVLDVQCGSELTVETVDYLDHCRGTVYDPFFFWEHVIGNLWIFYAPFLVWEVAFGRIKVIPFARMPSFGWILFWTILTQGFRSWRVILAQCYLTFCATIGYPMLVRCLAWITGCIDHKTWSETIVLTSRGRRKVIVKRMRKESLLSPFGKEKLIKIRKLLKKSRSVSQNVFDNSTTLEVATALPQYNHIQVLFELRNNMNQYYLFHDLEWFKFFLEASRNMKLAKGKNKQCK